MALYIDEKFKDASPVDTVNRIRSIFDDFGFEVEEQWNDSGVEMCQSLHISIKGTGMGSNGKGITEEFARASAYAELMERMQSGFMGLDKVSPLIYNDAVEFTKQDLMDNCGDILSVSAKVFAEFCPKGLTSEQLAEKLLELDGNVGTVKVAPFYDALNEKECYVPICLTRRLCASNGLAAGNSVEEALVQGFSEIVERYARVCITTKKLTPPTIPEEYIRQCPVSYKIISQIREAGYDVIVKDCSLGEGFPIVAVIYLDREKHTYHVHMGASPVFEIALERSLTETFQGCNLKKFTEIDSVINNKQEKIGINALRDAFLNSRVAYHAEFFANNPSYEFVPFEDRSKCTNHELFKGILEYVKRNGYSIYIRDMSFLGFNTFRIYIPGITEVIYGEVTSELPVITMGNNLKSCIRDMGNASVDELFELQLYLKYMQSREKTKRLSKISGLAMNRNHKYDIFLFNISLAYISWQMGNKAEGLKNAYAAQAYAWNKEDADFLSCLRKFYDFKSNKYEDSETLDIVSNFYKKETVEAVREVVQSNTNPFRRFLLECREGNCKACRYREFCYIERHKEIMDKLNAAAEAYDHKASFENMKKLFSAQ